MPSYCAIEIFDILAEEYPFELVPLYLNARSVSSKILLLCSKHAGYYYLAWTDSTHFILTSRNSGLDSYIEKAVSHMFLPRLMLRYVKTVYILWKSILLILFLIELKQIVNFIIFLELILMMLSLQMMLQFSFRYSNGLQILNILLLFV